MNRILKASFIVAMAMALAVPRIAAQSRHGERSESNHSRGNTRIERNHSTGNKSGNRVNNNGKRPGRDHGYRPGNSNNNNRPGHNQGFRPGNGSNNNRPGHNQGFRPGSGDNNNRPGHNQGFRPGNGNNNNRPGHNQGFRPGNGNNNNRPGHNQGFRPGNGNKPGYRPDRHPGYSHRPMRPGATRPSMMHRPYRPGLAPARPFYRPRPPFGWRPTYRVNLWTNILGITVGMTVNNAIDRLLTDGYTVTGYNSNEIYLTDVMQYNMLWPDATVYYNSGHFAGTRFYYSTLGYDLTRYNNMYGYFINRFGEPVLISDNANALSATWYGNNNQYLTLEFSPQLTDAGRRYFTTLSVGL